MIDVAVGECPSLHDLGGVERALEGSFELENSDDDEVVDD